MIPHRQSQAEKESELTILSVAYPLMPVSSGSGGGAEQILYLMDRELTSRGVRSLVVAAQGSEVLGQLYSTPSAEEEITNELREKAHAAHRRCLQEVLGRNHVDLIHYHGLDFVEYKRASSAVPQIATLHLPIGWYPPGIWADQGCSLVCVSQNQAHSSDLAHSLPVVPNGINVSSFRVSQARGDYLLWLGRVCPEKGVHLALKVAHGLDLPLIMAGPVHRFRYHEDYFDEQIRPYLDTKRRYIGPVDFDVKVDLLANARCLLVPSLAPETSSLVAIEAASSGTPVIALRSGALPEVVESGVTGFIVDSAEEMAEAVLRSGEILPQQCRSRAEARFSSSRMADDYLSLYSRIISGQSLAV